METRLRLDMLPQPDETTCGPTSLHAVYRFYGDQVDLAEMIPEVRRLENGGTLAGMLGGHALRRGYSATIFTYNVQIFDPTWFEAGSVQLREKLAEQARVKKNRKLRIATEGYLEFLELGGKLAFEDLTHGLIARYLARGIPILTGLSATYLYRAPREYGPKADFDDIRGKPAGHFVVLCGYDPASRKVLVADPLFPNPWFESHMYEIDVDRVICSILLGILTYDATLLIIEPKDRQPSSPLDGLAAAAAPAVVGEPGSAAHGHPDRR
ncbi:MAG TPA: C39 family peptidase [Phycisphaerales bacterium]|nr:C39 family peptidase [Phycisphaerales bacterium]